MAESTTAARIGGRRCFMYTANTISVSRSRTRPGNTTYRQQSSRHTSAGTSAVMIPACLRQAELLRNAASVRSAGTRRSSQGSV